MNNPYLAAGPDARKAAYLVALAHHGLYIQAAAEIRISPNTANGWRKSDPVFALACREAIEHATERFELEAIRRGVEGIDEPIVHQGRIQYLYEPACDKDGNPILNEAGEPCVRVVRDPETGKPVQATTKKYSDGLLGKVLEANVKKYARLTKLEMSGPEGGPIPTEESPLAIARKIAFALAVGLRAQKAAEAAGEDLV